GVSFMLADPAAALAQARDAAVANARARAEQLAKGSGASVGQVLVISENIGASPVVPLPMMERAVANDASSVPVQAGQLSYTAQVQVTYELK
ncbi:MAG: SIMPL domain-containing protein, partial [Oscillochloris sp.]|nr:SIMPL domain-containing protein [Oscillochloris sp.]